MVHFDSGIKIREFCGCSSVTKYMAHSAGACSNGANAKQRCNAASRRVEAKISQLPSPSLFAKMSSLRAKKGFPKLSLPPLNGNDAGANQQQSSAGGASLTSALSNMSLASSNDSMDSQRRRQRLQINLPGAEKPEAPAASQLPTSTQFNLQEEDLDTLEELGMGSGGTVFRVMHRSTGTVMAKKIIHQMDVQLSAEIVRELQILNKCQSPHIISFFGAYQNHGEVCICMEFVRAIYAALIIV
jgi:hypothetical protein